MISYTHYTDNIHEGFGAVNYGPYTRMRPKYKVSTEDAHKLLKD